MRNLAVVLLTATTLVLCLLVAPATAADAAPNNLVMLSTTADNPAQARSHVQVTSYGGDMLDSTNLARADAHDCSGCYTVAVAVQAVLATGNPGTITPQNLAIATNEACSRCATFAFAYQYVVTTNRPVYLTNAGRLQLAQVKREFAETAHSGLPFNQLDSRLHQLADEFRANIDAQLQQVGQSARGRVKERESQGPATAP